MGELQKSQLKSLPLPLPSDGIGGGGLLWRFGELIEAPRETSRRTPPATILGELVLEGDGRLLGEYVGVPGKDALGLEGVSPAAASVNRNSTHRRENDYRGSGVCYIYLNHGQCSHPLTSVSSVFSSSKALDFDVGDRVDNIDDFAPGAPERCRPAFSRSSSVHCKTVDSIVSISNRLASPLGVLRNWRRTFVTSLRSTLVLFDDLRSRRSASTRWSFMMTAWRSVRDTEGVFFEKCSYLRVEVSRSRDSSPSTPSPNPESWTKWIGFPRVVTLLV